MHCLVSIIYTKRSDELLQIGANAGRRQGGTREIVPMHGQRGNGDLRDDGECGVFDSGADIQGWSDDESEV